MRFPLIYETYQVGWAEKRDDGTYWVTFMGYEGPPLTQSLQEQIRKAVEDEQADPSS